jgi:hypothetical protein
MCGDKVFSETSTLKKGQARLRRAALVWLEVKFF